MYSLASSQVTLITGWLPRPKALSDALAQAPAATQASHSANVTSVLPTAKGLAIVTSCCGPSNSSSRPFSPSGEPMLDLPAGTTTIVGQPVTHSLNSDPGLAAFSFSCAIVSTRGPMIARQRYGSRNQRYGFRKSPR